MMLMKLTSKLSNKLKLGQLPLVDDDPGPYLEWYAHLFTANRIQYILTTESKSLFSIVMYGRGISDDNIFIKRWLEQMRALLSSSDYRLIYDRIIALNIGQIEFSRTNSKSILGSMNDMIRLLKTMLSIKDYSLSEMGSLINESIYSTIEYKRPCDIFSSMRIT